MVYASVRKTIHWLKLVDYLSVQMQKSDNDEHVPFSYDGREWDIQFVRIYNND